MLHFYSITHNFHKRLEIHIQFFQGLMEEKDEEDEDTDIESEEDIVEIFELF